MAIVIKIPTYSDNRGKLTSIDNLLPFDVKRAYYIYDVFGERGGHRHNVTSQALVCVKGSCNVLIEGAASKSNIHLNSPDKCLILEPSDWHIMNAFEPGTVLLVLASHSYDKEDYIYEK